MEAQKAFVTPAPSSGILPLRRLLDQRLTDGQLDLPLLPGVAMAVSSAAEREDSDARALADILKRDPAMAAHVLRVVNSPAYSPRGQIVSLQQAVARLGSARIREIALLIACRTGVFKARGFESDVNAVFAHSVATALLAQEVARTTRNNVEDAFLCGLLHDIGRPVLLQSVVALAGQASAVVDRAAALELVNELHCRAGTALARAWSLPESVSVAIINHHGELSESDPAIVHITALADVLAHALLDHAEPEFELATRHPALSALEIYPDAFAKIVSRAAQIRQTAQGLS